MWVALVTLNVAGNGWKLLDFLPMSCELWKLQDADQVSWVSAQSMTLINCLVKEHRALPVLLFIRAQHSHLSLPMGHQHEFGKGKLIAERMYGGLFVYNHIHYYMYIQCKPIAICEVCDVLVNCFRNLKQVCTQTSQCPPGLQKGPPTQQQRHNAQSLDAQCRLETAAQIALLSC